MSDVEAALAAVENRSQWDDCTDDAVVLAAEVRRLTAWAAAARTADAQPNLDLASTRELLEELRARGEAFAAIGEPAAKGIATVARSMLYHLPPALLD